ncbi:MAG: ComEC/Rec2 family competence protein [Verrucomicrobia bacterium]|jgi:ComEC/Rec2-related protein|nr:ComEC/Rec2 family competence protein [Verrucomicrobiota bacterium]
MLRRPLIGIAICVVIGTWLGVAVGHSAHALAGVCVASVVCTLSHCLRYERVAQLSLFVLIAFAVHFGAALGRDHSLASVLAKHAVADDGQIEVVGEVQSDLVDVPNGGRGGRGRFLLRADTICIDGTLHPIRDMVQVVMYGVPRYPPVYGESWKLTGRLSSRRGKNRVARNRYTLYVGLRDTRLVDRTRSAFMAWCFRSRRRAAAMLSMGIEAHPEISGVVNALLLGYRARLPADVRRCFMRTGTMHVFAISGLHVGILCTIIVFMLGVLRVPRTAWVFALAPLLFVYTNVTGARASAIRASAMMVAYLLAPLVRRGADGVSALALAAIAILLWQPEQLFDIGFLYSFSVVAGIMAIVPIFDERITSWWRPDPFLPADDAEGQRWWDPVLRGAVRTFSVSLAAWLTSAPLSLYFFGRFSPVALIGNCLAIPLAFLILVTGCLSIVAGSAAGFLAEVFNHANWCFVKVLVSGMQQLESIRYGWIETGRIPIWGVALWYGGLVLAAVLLRRRQRGAADPAEVTRQW